MSDPHDNPPPPDEAVSRPSSRLVAGMAAGFGAPDPAEPPDQSVVERILGGAGLRSRITLREAPSPAPARLLKPRGPESASWPERTGKYQVQGELARGGVGVVFKGHDLDLGRDVAVKMLHERFLGNPELLHRFVEEAQIGGQLQHPGIVPVYDLGLSDERPYFTMKLVKGRTLAALFEERAVPADSLGRLLGVFEQVCQTVAYAHARGVIHRDLKPANVMVGAFGEVQVVDWGMGKVLPAGGTAEEERSRRKSAQSVVETVRSQPGSAGSQSIVGSVMGTPAYMPPEQANGDVDRMDERSDVFALGAILCELLTGAPPYLGSTEEQMSLAAGARLEACHERLDACGADEALRGLCDECLRPAPAARPRNAGVVAERVEAFLTSAESRARAAQIEAAEERVRSLAARRAQRLTLALAASVLLSLGLAGGGLWWAERAAQARSADATARASTALTEAGMLLGQARAGGELALWARALDAAENAAELAAIEDTAPAQRLAAGALLGEVRLERDVARELAAARAREERLLSRLDRSRVPGEESIARRDFLRLEGERLDREYDAAFAEFFEGTGVSELAAEDAAAAVAATDSSAELAVALDHWALVRIAYDLAPTSDEPERLLELAERVGGGDPWRAELRSLLPALPREQARLLRLAERAPLPELSAGSLLLLGEALWIVGAEERALEVYRRARELHPSDFGICLRLGVLLYRTGDEHHEEAAEVLRVARALNPRMDGVGVLLSLVLQHLRLFEEGRRLCEDALRVDPRSRNWRFLLTGYLLHLGDWPALEEQSYMMLDYAPTSPADWNVYQAELRNHALALERQGRLEEALSEYEFAARVVGEYLASIEGPDAPPDVSTRVSASFFPRDLERLRALINNQPALEALWSGARPGRNAEEWAAAAEHALWNGELERAASTWRAGLAAEPALAGDKERRMAAIRAAARAGEAGDAEWTGQALSWLWDELESQRVRAEQQPGTVADRLWTWRRDVDLAGIRDQSRLASLPLDLRAECREFWAAVDVLERNLRDRVAGR